MSCHWTTKVSLLIDEELSREEAAATAHHLKACAACQQVREDFLRLRRQLTSYTIEPNPAAQQHALRKILASDAAAHAGETRRSESTAVNSAIGLRGQLARMFRAWQHAPAMMASVALIIVGIIALLAYVSLRHKTTTDKRAESVAFVPQKDIGRSGAKDGGSDAARVQPSPSLPLPDKSVTPSAETGSRAVVKVKDKTGGRERVLSVVADRNARPREMRATQAGRETIARVIEKGPAQGNASTQVNVARGVEPASVARDSSADDVSRFERYASSAAQFQTTRHVEQAQLLLRSFRNARLADEGPASDIAYEKERSRRLLYRNIVLRREAASNGNLPVEKLLSSLEPILIDIANLPEKPLDDDIRSIKERMQRKNIVAMLQVNLAPAARFN